MTTPNYSLPKLGKLIPRKNRLTLKLSKYIDTTVLPTPPLTLKNNTNISNWTMMGNDVAGDCTCAAAGHGIMSWTDAVGDLVTPPLASIIKAYTAVSGYNPVTGSNDNGAECMTVLEYWEKTGVDGHIISGFVELNIHNQTELKIAIYLFELLYIGVQLPLTAQNQTNRWAVTDPTLQGNAAPGSWGGHCVIVIGYNADGVWVISWGQVYKMTWGFWHAYVDESYAILSPDFFSNNVSPNGFAKTLLQQDLSALNS